MPSRILVFKSGVGRGFGSVQDLTTEVHLFLRERVRLLEGEAVVFTWANMDCCP